MHTLPPPPNTHIRARAHTALAEVCHARGAALIVDEAQDLMQMGLLDRLDASKQPDDMNLPGYKFHQLKGSRKYEFAVSVTGNWRITFEFEGDDATNVNLEDHH